MDEKDALIAALKAKVQLEAANKLLSEFYPVAVGLSIHAIGLIT